jgi:lysophospholipase L1-like esterase
MVAGFRRELGIADLPVVLVAPHGVGESFHSLSVVRKAILGAPKRLRNTRVVDAAIAARNEGLLPDGVHLTREAEQRLGALLAEAVSQNSSPNATPPTSAPTPILMASMPTAGP